MLITVCISVSLATVVTVVGAMFEGNGEPIVPEE